MTCCHAKHFTKKLILLTADIDIETKSVKSTIYLSLWRNSGDNPIEKVLRKGMKKATLYIKKSSLIFLILWQSLFQYIFNFCVVMIQFVVYRSQKINH
jgi:hypothetical protein